MNGREALRIARQIESSKGIKVYRQTANLTRSYQIMCMNFDDLAKLLAWFSVPTNAIPVFNVDHPERMNNFWLLASRHLHNYLASVQTLIDHMRRFIGKETHVEFKKQYELRLKDLTKSPLSSLIPDLRSYFLHNDIPPIGCVLSAKKGGDTETYISLDCAELLKWDRWKPSSRDYLTKAGSSLKILDVLRQYQSMTSDFFTWFHTELLRTYKAELDELSELNKRLGALSPRNESKGLGT